MEGMSLPANLPSFSAVLCKKCKEPNGSTLKPSQFGSQLYHNEFGTCACGTLPRSRCLVAAFWHGAQVAAHSRVVKMATPRWTVSARPCYSGSVVFPAIPLSTFLVSRYCVVRKLRSLEELIGRQTPLVHRASLAKSPTPTLVCDKATRLLLRMMNTRRLKTRERP
eukprot:2514136-Amphidinium_carterae.1